MGRVFLILILGASLGGCAYGPAYYVDDDPYLYGGPSLDVGVGFFGVGGSYGGGRHHVEHHGGRHQIGHHGGRHHVGHKGGGGRRGGGGHRR